MSYVREIGQGKWRRKAIWKALDNHVIAVGVEGYGHDWAAYIGAVPAKDHEVEWEDAMNHGSKLSKGLAEAIFPEFAKSGLHYRE
jgi:hypothetical protein